MIPAALALAGVLAAWPAGAAAPDADPMRAIAIHEDQRKLDDDVLVGFLGSDDAAVRRRAVRAIGRIQDTTTVAALLPLLHDPDIEVRRETIFELGQIGSRAALDTLESRLDDPDAASVQLAIEAIGKLRDQTATPRIVPFLRNEAPALRGEAAVALWRLADSTAVGALLERHDDPDPAVRWRVLYALEKIRAPEQIVLIAALHLGDHEWLVRAHAARTMGLERSDRATAYLLQTLDDASPAVVVEALRGLRQVADTVCGACAPALARALDHPNPYVRVTAAGVLGDRFAFVGADSAGRAGALETLEKHLADPDAATRGACARALIAQRGAEALGAVDSMLADSSRYVRAAVLQAVATLPAADAEPILRPRIGPDHPLFDRMNALLGLGGLKDSTVAPDLRAALTDTATLIVAAAAAGLETLGDSASVPALAAAYAARAADADADARISIRDALRTLGGRAFADSVEAAHPSSPPPPTDYPPDFQDPPPVHGARIHTTAGDIEWAFEPKEAPQTVRNFVTLAGRGYFDGTSVHRVVPDFVIQDGDPTGTGWGGPGYTIRCEYNRLRYDTGMVGMALSGKDTGGSQWFITQSPQPHLDGRYTIFARVTSGMDVVNRIVQGDRILSVDILK